MEPGRYRELSRRKALRRGLAGAAGLLVAASTMAGPPPQHAEGQAELGHPDLAVGRPVAPGYLRSQARGGQRLLRPAEQAIPTNVRHPHLRAVAPAGQAGRQVLAHPQHDPRQQRPRDGRLHGADRPAARRPRWSIRARGGGLAVQGLRRRLQGADSALHRAHPAAGAVLRGRLPGAALQALRHRRRPGPEAFHGRRRRGPGHHRPAAAATAASCCTSSTRWPQRLPGNPRWRP